MECSVFTSSYTFIYPYSFPRCFTPLHSSVTRPVVDSISQDICPTLPLPSARAFSPVPLETLHYHLMGMTPCLYSFKCFSTVVRLIFLNQKSDQVFPPIFKHNKKVLRLLTCLKQSLLSSTISSLLTLLPPTYIPNVPTF